jgi:hypothetical protein
MCRSLLAGDQEHSFLDHALNRLQAGSYIPTKPELAQEYRTHCEKARRTGGFAALKCLHT